jgi:hypothetical protein
MFLGREKIINPLGQKPAFGWFLSCVGKMDLITETMCKKDQHFIQIFFKN